MILSMMHFIEVKCDVGDVITKIMLQNKNKIESRLEKWRFDIKKVCLTSFAINSEIRSYR